MGEPVKKKEYASVDDLLTKAANGIEERDVECSFGTVRVRDLTGAQSILLSKGATKRDRHGEHIDADAATTLTILYGLVTPSLSPGQVEEFVRKANQKDVNKIIQGITGVEVGNEDDLKAAFRAVT